MICFSYVTEKSVLEKKVKFLSENKIIEEVHFWHEQALKTGRTKKNETSVNKFIVQI